LSVTQVDVLIIGAGLSGIGIACHFARECPAMRFTILERRDRIGGTWDLFRYPGIRSDSDMFSFGYEIRPWHGLKVLADGPSIRNYIEEAASEFRVKEKIHFGLKVTSADWSSDQRRWNLTALEEGSGTLQDYSCRFLVCCTGYYNHDIGFQPELPGQDKFKGVLFHPQQWPDQLDYRGKKMVVIGSGATAVTLVPALADTAAHVTMLQRSPSYIFSLPSIDRLTARLSRILPHDSAYRLARWRNIWIQRAAYVACRRWPKLMRRHLLSHVCKHVGPDIDMRHFTPKYMPWDERLCAVPDADLFKTLRRGKASIETDQIDTFTEEGVLLKSGKELKADIVIVATGLKLQMLGGMRLSVDGVPRSIGSQVTYKGVLLEDLPNLAWIFGYVNASWTLKVERRGICAACLSSWKRASLKWSCRETAQGMHSLKAS
jgi:monooxygenase